MEKEVDAKHLASLPEFVATLEQHPQLEPKRLILDSVVAILHCQIFYKDLMVLTDGVTLIKDRQSNSVAMWGSVPDSISLSLSPTLPVDDAIARAKSELEFGHSCVFYRLGIYDLNAGQSMASSKNYKLVWHITGGYGSIPEVVVDANDGKVYYSDDGMRE